MSKSSLSEFCTEKICHLKAVCNRNISCFRKLFCQTFNPSLSEILYRFLSYRQNHIVFAFGRCLQTFEKVGVITTCKSSVTCDHYITGFLIYGFFRINRRKIGILSCNIFQCLMKLCKVRAAGFRPFLCLTQFGGCYQLHGLGNLHGTLYTFDTQLYRFHISSHTIIPS